MASPRLILVAVLVLGACTTTAPRPPLSPFDRAVREQQAHKLTADAVAAAEAGHLPEALHGFDEALALDPGRLEIAYEKAYALYQGQRFDEAAHLLEPLAA